MSLVRSQVKISGKVETTNTRNFIKGNTFSQVNFENLLLENLPMSLFLRVDNSKAILKNVKITNVIKRTGSNDFLF